MKKVILLFVFSFSILGYSQNSQDFDGPSFSDFTLNINEVDITNGDVDLIGTITVSDQTGIDLNSLPSVYIWETSDTGGTMINNRWTIVSGDQYQVILESTFTLTQNSKPGTWNFFTSGFTDLNGYRSTQGSHYGPNFEVINQNSQDFDGPSFSDFTLNINEVDITNGDVDLIGTITVSDQTGIDLNSLPSVYIWETSDTGGTMINNRWTIVSGDQYQVILESTFTLTQNSKPGTWNFFTSGFTDLNGYRSTQGSHYGPDFEVINQSLQIKEIHKSTYSIYPNPTKGFLKINSSEPFINLTIEVYDLKGSRILSKPFKNDDNINVSELKPSIYFYKIIDGNKLKQSGKLIKE